jgi:hypothetical protein
MHVVFAVTVPVVGRVSGKPAQRARLQFVGDKVTALKLMLVQRSDFEHLLQGLLNYNQ